MQVLRFINCEYSNENALYMVTDVTNIQYKDMLARCLDLNITFEQLLNVGDFFPLAPTFSESKVCRIHILARPNHAR